MASQNQARTGRNTRTNRPQTPAAKAAPAKAAPARTGSAKPAPAKAAPAIAASPGAGAGTPAAENASAWQRLARYVTANRLEFSTLVVSVLGLGVAIYMTIEHYSQNAYALCPASSGVNCAKVTTSPQAYVFHIPVAVLGLAFFVFMVAINSPWAWRSGSAALHWTRLASVIIGMAFVLYLVYAELFLIGAICLYCTAVHVLTFVLFAVVIARVAISGVRPRQTIR